METNIVDVYFYFSLDQKSEMLDELAGKLVQLPGVKNANINPRTPSLLGVKYDPDQLSSGDLVHYVRAAGYPAAMLGM